MYKYDTVFNILMGLIVQNQYESTNHRLKMVKINDMNPKNDIRVRMSKSILSIDMDYLIKATVKSNIMVWKLRDLSNGLKVKTCTVRVSYL